MTVKQQRGWYCMNCGSSLQRTVTVQTSGGEHERKECGSCGATVQ